MARILTVEQVAEKLQLKPLTVREYLRKGKIPGRKLGKSWRVLETDLEWFISSKSTTAAEERISALGICADIPDFGTEEFLENKRKEIELEEAKLQRSTEAA